MENQSLLKLKNSWDYNLFDTLNNFNIILTFTVPCPFIATLGKAYFCLSSLFRTDIMKVRLGKLTFAPEN